MFARDGVDVIVKCALPICAAVAVAGCGSPHTTTFPNTLPQTAASPAWTTHHGRVGALLYVALPYDGSVSFYTFPSLKFAGSITGLSSPQNLCVDKNGHIWILDSGSSSYPTTIYEYDWGGTKPIATLADPYGAGQACAVDPSTGNLAVANEDERYHTEVLIYPNASGLPKEYAPYEVDLPRSITYDSYGDLFIAGQVHFYDAGTDWLPKGASAFRRFKTNPHTRSHNGAEWGDGALTEIAHPDLIHRYAIENGKPVFLGSMTLDVNYVGHFTVHERYLIASAETTVYLFNYPAGGEPVTGIGASYPAGVAVSVKE